MKIHFNAAENAIEIKDGRRNLHRILQISLLLHVAHAIIQLAGKPVMDYDLLTYIWAFIGVVAFFVLLTFWFNQSSAAKIPVEEIAELREKTILGTQRFSLKLKNGKFRNLGELNNAAERAKLHALLTIKNKNP